MRDADAKVFVLSDLCAADLLRRCLTLRCLPRAGLIYTLFPFV